MSKLPYVGKLALCAADESTRPAFARVGEARDVADERAPHGAGGGLEASQRGRHGGRDDGGYGQRNSW